MVGTGLCKKFYVKSNESSVKFGGGEEGTEISCCNSRETFTLHEDVIMTYEGVCHITDFQHLTWPTASTLLPIIYKVYNSLQRKYLINCKILTEALSLALIKLIGIFWVWFKLVAPSSSVGVIMSS